MKQQNRRVDYNITFTFITFHDLVFWLFKLLNPPSLLTVDITKVVKQTINESNQVEKQHNTKKTEDKLTKGQLNRHGYLSQINSMKPRCKKA